MNIYKLLLVIILLSFNYGCDQSKNKSNPNDKREDEISAFEQVDVYRNPNTFEQYMGRLQPGDTPPGMTIEKWYNGSPVNSFDQGKVYVVEFFASWCQPCRKSIPHLNQLQKEFDKQLVVVAVAASEAEPNPKKLEKLLQAKKEVLTYRVAYTSDKKTFRDWNWGARNTGLPWVFVIDKKGQLAWFGQPFQSRFEPVLRSVLNDTFLPEQEVAINESEYQSRKTLWEVQEQFWSAIGNEDWPSVLALGDQLYQSGDQLFYYEMAQLFQIRYEQLNEKAEAIAFAHDLKNDLLSGIPEGLGFMASVLFRNSKATPEDLELALEITKRANELTLDENPDLLYLSGQLYDRLGQKELAHVNYRRALDFTDDPELENELEDKINSIAKEDA